MGKPRLLIHRVFVKGDIGTGLGNQQSYYLMGLDMVFFVAVAVAADAAAAAA